MAATRGGILVIRGGAIGDFILTLPVLSALRGQFPEARLEVLGYPHITQLARAADLADDLRSIEAAALAGFFARGGILDPALQDYFAGFAMIISYLYDPDGIFQSNIGRCSKAQFIAGPHRPEEKAGLHATRAFLRPLERLAIFDAEPVPRLRLTGARQVKTGSRVLAIHPGSGSERKNWPETKWAELLERLLLTSQLNLLLVGGEAEGDRLSRLSKKLPSARVQIARNLPLNELAQRLASCDLFIGHDSGITHLAAALGLPAVVLWGESTEEIWRPQGENLLILKHDQDLAHLPSAKVLEQLHELLQRVARN